MKSLPPVSNKNRSPDRLIELLKSLWGHVTPKRKSQLFWLTVLMVLASFAEVASLGALVPFLGVITSPESVFEQSKFQWIIGVFAIQSPTQLLVPVTILFCLAVLVSGATRMGLLWATTRLSYGLGADLSMSAYRRTLYQPYLTHISRNSSELVASISTKIGGVILHVINPIIIVVSSTIILVSILTLLVLLNPTVSLVAFFGFAAIYLAIIKASKSKLIENSKRISSETTSVIKALQEGLGGIRDVLLDGAQEVYCSDYKKADSALRGAQASNYFIANSPRFIIESAGMVLIAVIALYLAGHDKGSGETIITLGIFGLGAQRLLPVLQQIYYSLTTVKGNQATLNDVVNLLDQPLPNVIGQGLVQNKRMPFKSEIRLSDVTFRYGNNLPNVLDGISLTIPKGRRIGFIGSTGSGKSTLIDVVMGLLNPMAGSLTVDNQYVTDENACEWQRNIAHVPQTIHLIDASIAENIAFGERADEIDLARVKDASTKAQIDKVIESWHSGYATVVGERGVRLSGGQRQRIAIARALYKQSDVIVFDEATSALDEKTEASLMSAIDELSDDLTILIIAHRVSTLKQCDQIIELHSGKIKRYGTYAELIGSGN